MFSRRIVAQGLMTEEFHRIRRLPPYVFAEVNAAKARARARQVRTSSISAWAILTARTPQHIVAKLVETVSDPRTHR